MIYYHLPGIFEHFRFYVRFLELYETYPHMFYDWCSIGSFYGCAPGVIWSGGRLPANVEFNEDLVVDFLKEKQIECSLVFSNLLIDENHLNDVHCNKLLEKFNYGRNSVILTSDLLKNYIKENYPNYKIISSITKCIYSKENLEKELKDTENDLVCINHGFNKDIEYLSDLPRKRKCELLVNSQCYPFCQRAMEHYSLISKSALFESDIFFECKKEQQLFYTTKKSHSFISIEEIQDIYEPLDFKHFKIEGRSAREFDLLEVLLYYMVKPEFQLEIRERMILE